MDQQARKPNLGNKAKFVFIFGGLVIVLGLLTVIFALSPLNPWRNFAHELASPIERALLANGATKVCSGGSHGLGPDNAQPTYSANFQLNVGKSEAEKLIYKVASENGFNVEHKDSSYDSIEWYSDSGKDSPYAELEEGKMKLNLSIYNESPGSEALTCDDGKALRGDENHTALSLSLVLPSRK